MLNGSGKAGEPSWARAGNPPPVRRKGTDGLPPGFSRKKDIPFPGVINLQPQRIGSHLLVGFQYTKTYVLSSCSTRGNIEWMAEPGRDDEKVTALIPAENGILVASENKREGSVRLIDWYGDIRKRKTAILFRNVRFHPDPKDGGIYFIDSRNTIRKWDPGQIENSTTVVQRNNSRGEGLFLFDGDHFFFQERVGGEDILWAYDRTGNPFWKNPFITGNRQKFNDAFLGGVFDPYHRDYQGLLFISTQDAWIFALKIATGEVAWDTRGPLKNVTGPVLLQPAKGIQTVMAGDEAHLFVSNPEQGALSAVSLYSQTEEKKPFPFSFSGPGGFSRPVALGDTIWMAAACRDGFVYIFKRSGEQIGRIETKVTHPFDPVYLGSNTFIVPTADAPTDKPRQLTIFGFE